MGAGLPNVSMAPKVNASSRRRGATAVFKSVLHVLGATVDKPGHAMLTRQAPVEKIHPSLICNKQVASLLLQ